MKKVSAMKMSRFTAERLCNLLGDCFLSCLCRKMATTNHIRLNKHAQSNDRRNGAVLRFLLRTRSIISISFAADHHVCVDISFGDPTNCTHICSVCFAHTIHCSANYRLLSKLNCNWLARSMDTIIAIFSS